jgi:hypothetical protein
MPSLRSLGVLPNRDRTVLAIDPKYGIHSFDDLRQKKPAIRIATATNDGTNFIGWTGSAYLKAHNIDETVLASWGARWVTAQKPDVSCAMVTNGETDAIL